MTVDANIVAGVLAVVLQVFALYGAKKWRGTTLMVPFLWVATAASCLLFLAFVRGQGPRGITLAVIHFAAAAITLCPTVAVMGAKRPQDRGWQWVVATLWLILVWPALANPAGPELEVYALWRVFIAAIVALGLLNYLATKHWLASMAVARAQLLLFSKSLGLSEPEFWLPGALAYFCFAALLVTLRRKKRVPPDAILPDHTARWLQFRDAYGAFWGLRIMQRVNEAAELRHWPVRLTWIGFEKKVDDPIDEPHKAEIDRTFDTLLRRFL